MHYMADDLDIDAWVKAPASPGSSAYLASWGLFAELYPADAP